MAEEGEDAVAMLSAPENLSEEEQDELRRELAKVRAILSGPLLSPKILVIAYGKRLKGKESIVNWDYLESQQGRGGRGTPVSFWVDLGVRCSRKWRVHCQ